MTVHVIGGGLAGCEAAWQLVRQGISVTLHEMRPVKSTAAHKTDHLAELVCSNSLKSLAEDSAPGLLKREMSDLDSLIIRAAMTAKVPAGQALAVDREVFSNTILTALESSRFFKKEIGEITQIPTLIQLEAGNDYWIIASGPLTSDALSAELAKLTSEQSHLHFYDAIAPVIDADSIDHQTGFMADRWQKDDQPPGDYLNLPLTEAEYYAFVDAVIGAEKMPLHDFESPKYFESCLPIEVMAERGRDTLRFGPMKPVGLTDPRTGRWPFANLQLRQENLEGTMFSMVGFQTKMKWPEQKRVFAMIPGLEQAEFLRFGSIHRNTYINSPKSLHPNLSFKSNPRVFLAGQLTGVEGYTESAAMGLIAGRNVAAQIQGGSSCFVPPGTLLGALLSYVTDGPLGTYSPMNANFGLLPALPKTKGITKKDRQRQKIAAAEAIFSAWQQSTTH